MSTTKKAAQLTCGDRIQTETGDWVTVKDVRNGVFKGHVLVEFRAPAPDGNTWGHLPRTAQVAVQ